MDVCKTMELTEDEQHGCIVSGSDSHSDCLDSMESIGVSILQATDCSQKDTWEAEETGKQLDISQALCQQEDNIKCAELYPLSNTSLSDLPIELIEFILIKAVVMEVLDMKLAKSAWHEKVDLVISRFETVCIQWSNIFTTHVRNELCKTLDRTAQEKIRLQILNGFPIHFGINAVAALRDEIFLSCSTRSQRHGCLIKVYDRNNLSKVKDVILFQEIDTSTIVACSLSNCLYVLGGGLSLETMLCLSVLCIAKDEEDEFNISPFICDERLSIYSFSVSANGNVIVFSDLNKQHDVGHLVGVYDANGILQHEIMLLHVDNDDFWCIIDVFQISNGNLVLVTHDRRRKFLEIDMSGNIVRQYESKQSTSDSRVRFADIYGRLMITDPHFGMELLDSEFNPIDFSVLRMNRIQLDQLWWTHFNRERNEIMCMFSKDNYNWEEVVTTYVVLFFRFTEE